MPNNPTQSLTPSVPYKTNFPFPKRSAQNEYAAELGTEEGRTITFEACSELMQYRFPVDVFRPKQDDSGRAEHIALIHDKQNQPIVFTIGGDNHLYMLVHVNNAPEGWQRFDITPSSAKGFLFGHCDVLQHDEVVHVAVTISTASADSKGTTDTDTHSLWHVSFPTPSLSWSDEDRRVTGFAAESLAWYELPNDAKSPSKKPITTMSLCSGPPLEGSSAAFWIAVGTRQTNKDQAAFYIVDPSPKTPTAWSAVTLAQNGDAILGVQAAAVGSVRDNKRTPSFAVLFKRPGDSGYGVEVDAFKGAARNRSVTDLRVANLGKLEDFCISKSCYGLSDIIVASERGLAFYDSQVLDRDPIILLPNTSFRQVVCAEVYNNGFEKDENILARLSLLAVSDLGELYFIQGFRDRLAKVAFNTISGIPIRTGVRGISTQFNYGYQSTEILYVSNKANELCHLIRNPLTSTWNESKIQIRCPPGTPGFVKKAAHVTTITLTDGNRKAVPSGYPVKITGDRKTVYVDSKIVSLSTIPTTLTTPGANGQIVIVAPAEDSIGAAPYHISLTEFKPASPSHTDISVLPAQRVHRLMSEIKTGDDLSKVADKNGEPIFAGVEHDKLAGMTLLVSCANNNPAPSPENKAAADTELQDDTMTKIAFNRTTTSAPTPSSAKLMHRSAGDWFAGAWDDMVGAGKHAIQEVEHAVDTAGHEIAHVAQEVAHEVVEVGKQVLDTAGHVLGDVIEGIKQGVKAITKVVMAVAGPVLKLAVSIAGKVMGFALKGIGFVLKGVSAGLKALGVDTKKLDSWIEYLFDGDSTAKTQKVLDKVVKGCLRTCDRFLDQNKHVVHDFIREGRNVVRTYLDDPTLSQESTAKSEKSALMETLEGLLNNPVTKTLLSYNPMSWIMEAVMEDMDPNSFKLPPKLEEIVKRIPSDPSAGINAVVNCLTSLFEGLINSLSQIAANPSDILSIITRQLKQSVLQIYDALAEVVEEVFQVIIDVFKMLQDFLTAEWSLGSLTDMWKDFSGQNFSILGFVTYVLAAIINLGSMLVNSELPFKNENDAYDDWNSLKLPQLKTSTTNTISHRMVATPATKGQGKPAQIAYPMAMQHMSAGTTAPSTQQPVLHKREAAATATAHDDNKETLERWENIIDAVGEVATFLAAAKEIFHLTDFTPELTGKGKPKPPNKGLKVRDDGPKPPAETKGKYSPMMIFYNMTHVSISALAGVSMACTITCTVLKFNIHPDPHGAEYIPYILHTAYATASAVGFGMYLHRMPAPGGLFQSGGAVCGAISDLITYSNEPADKKDTIEQLLKYGKFAGACSGVVGVVASETDQLQVAFLAGSVDGVASLVGCLGEIVHAATPHH